MQDRQQSKHTTSEKTAVEIPNPVSPVTPPDHPHEKSVRPDDKQGYSYSHSLAEESISSAHKQEITTSSSRRSGVSILRWWLPELSAAAFSIASLLAIAAILQAYDHKSLVDSNLPKSLTLNGLIAAIATFDRVFLIVPVGSAISQETWLWFANNAKSVNPRSRLPDLTISDSASRGAWGSFLFIFYARRRWLALFGALLTLSSLTIGTFVQQLISIENLALNDPGSASRPGNIPRTTIFNDTSLPRGQIGYGTPLSTLSPAYRGIFAQTAEPVQATCLTGNCTFPPTPSLAVCGTCTPLSYHKTTCNETVQPDNPNGPFGIPPHCNYVTNTSDEFTIMENVAHPGLMGTIFQVQTSSGLSGFTDPDIYYLWRFLMMGYPYGSLPGSPGDHRLTASQCALWMCVNVIETDVSSGVQNQTIASSVSRMTSEEHIKQDNLTWHFDMSGTLQSDQYDGLYVADTNTYQFLLEALQAVVNGTVISDGGGYLTSQDSVLGIWNGTTDLDQWIDNLAVTLTNYVRTANPARDPRYDGTAYQLGYRIQWYWIIPPAIMVAMSVLLLALVMQRTVSSEVSSWKASPLTLLLLDVDGAIKKDALDLRWPDVANGAECGIGDRSVVLKREKDGGWKFRGV